MTELHQTPNKNELYEGRLIKEGRIFLEVEM